MTEHTPGPWAVYDCDNGNLHVAPFTDTKGDCVAWIFDHNDANARLIAAAPETAAERDRLRGYVRMYERAVARMNSDAITQFNRGMAELKAE